MEHRLTLEDRRKLTLSGAKDVISFDENAILLETSEGLLAIDGEGLHIVKMSSESGEMLIEGEIDGMVYRQSEEAERRSFFSRLFR